MKRIAALALALALAACGDHNNDNTGDKPKDAGAGSDASPPGQDAGSGGTARPFAYCIDRPDQAESVVQRPPATGLPCDMVPPAALH